MGEIEIIQKKPPPISMSTLLTREKTTKEKIS